MGALFILGLVAGLSAPADTDCRAIRHPPDATAEFGRGHAARAADRSCVNAEARWLEAVRLAPGYTDAHLAIAQCLVERGAFTEARARLNQAAAACDTHSGVARMRGEIDARHRDAEAALANRRAAIRAGLTEADRDFIGGDPEKEEWLIDRRAKLRPGETLTTWQAPALTWAEAAAFFRATESRRSAASHELVYDPQSGNMYAVSRDGQRTVVNGENLRTGAQWRNVHERDGFMYGEDKEGRQWAFDPNTGAYKRSDGASCVGKGAARRCFVPHGGGR